MEKKNSIKSFVALFAVLIAIVFGITRRLSPENPKKIKSTSQDVPKEFSNSPMIGPPPSDKSSYDFLLFESIFSIIQNYYVDEDRVSVKEIILSTLMQLRSSGDIELSIEPKEIIVKVKNHSILIDQNLLTEVEDGVKNALAISELIRDEKKPLNSQNWLHSGRFKFLNAMLSSLDPHSSVLNSASYKELKQGTEGEFGGLGVVVSVRDNLLTVIKPIPNSPAERANIEKEDQILSINGKGTFGESLESLVEFMRGAPGTKVDILLMRNNYIKPLDLSIRREVIQVESVSSSPLEIEKKTYLQVIVENFSSRTTQEIIDNIRAAESKFLLSGIILDLRGNPGGLLDQAVHVSDLFLKKGLIVSTRGRRLEIEKAEVGVDEFDYPLVVLIDGDSASASEIVAGAIKDNDRGIVIGKPSFGKGSVQTIFEIPGEQAIKLTIARYYTPNGTSIQNRGIKPDIWLQPLVKNKDNQNLLGLFRYHNERFLPHTLKESEKKLYANNKESMISYYIDSTASLNSNSDPQGYDFDLRVALKILSISGKVTDKLGPTHDVRFKASLAIESSIEELRMFTSVEENNSIFWLKDRFDVDWNLTHEHDINEKNIAVNLEFKSPVVRGEDGTIPVNWRIENRGLYPLERISIFFQLDSESGETFEYLVGKVPENGVMSGKALLPITAGFGTKNLVINCGISKDGILVKYIKDQHIVEIKEGLFPNLTIETLGLEEIVGNSNGIIEPKEKANLRVKVSNLGRRIARDLQIDVFNLSGSQISLLNSHEEISSLNSDEYFEFSFPFEASHNLYSKDVLFGLVLSASNLEKPIKVQMSVPGQDTFRASAKNVGH